MENKPNFQLRFYWTYFVTCLLFYLNGCFVNASFNINDWPRDSREIYGFVIGIFSFLMGMHMLVSYLKAKEMADEILRRKENEQKRAGRGGT